ncbi:cytochrome P450 family 71 subfamily A polypeptide 16 [Euphorbia peplus]|nr:cytochrome P450 family 71 subfamily A polypeptide 16 [Euphorbia peplus]
MSSLSLFLEQCSNFPVISLITLIILLLKWSSSFKTKSSDLPPSPPSFPIIGNLHQLGLYPHRAIKTLSEMYGPIMLLHLGSTPTLIISSA